MLTWIVRLRWLAVTGQILATTVARFGIGLDIPIAPILCVIALTFLTNLPLVRLAHSDGAARRRIVPPVIILDVLLLSGLLYFTGGTQNPFSILYVLHIVMAVVVLGTAWTSLIAAIASGRPPRASGAGARSCGRP